MNFTHITSREDKFRSRFFNFQKSHKYLVKLRDGNYIESSCFEHFKHDKLVDLAIDISTMVGCPMDCAFCASSSLHFHRYFNADY